jgi:hypothetical protein
MLMTVNSLPVLAYAVFTLSGGISWAQSSEPHDAWLMKNYRFTGPPPAGTVRPTDPVLAELREIQNTVMAILRKANFGEYPDYAAALAAAAQAAANAQLIGAITECLQSTQTMAASAEPKSDAPPYLIAFKDRTLEAATAYWVDGSMLNYMTLTGAHVQVRLGLVDRRLSTELNRQRKLEFRLPE